MTVVYMWNFHRANAERLAAQKDPRRRKKVGSMTYERIAEAWGVDLNTVEDLVKSMPGHELIYKTRRLEESQWAREEFSRMATSLWKLREEVDVTCLSDHPQ